MGLQRIDSPRSYRINNNLPRDVKELSEISV